MNFGIYESDIFEYISVHYVKDKKSKYFCSTYSVAGDQDSRVILEKAGKMLLVPAKKLPFYMKL